MPVAVVGSINVDIILGVATLPRAGETVMARDRARAAGGKGANQAVAAARMGAATRLLAAIGDDADGRWMLEQLAAAGVAVSGVSPVSGDATGTAYIAVDAAGENQIIVVPGANAALTAAMLPATGARDILLAQLEIPAATVAAAFARPARLRILNATPAIPAAIPLIATADIAIVNQHELAVFAACEPVDAPQEAAMAARRLIAREDQLVIVTLGAGGAVAVWRDRHVHVPAWPVQPVDTVGAGDCFCGALAALLDEGATIERAMATANVAAALCTLTPGAVPAMPDRAAVDAAMARAS